MRLILIILITEIHISHLILRVLLYQGRCKFNDKYLKENKSQIQQETKLCVFYAQVFMLQVLKTLNLIKEQGFDVLILFLFPGANQVQELPVL